MIDTGTRIGAYTVEDIVGRGPEATVYRARHNDLDEIVALKVYDDQAVANRVAAEIKYLNKLDHPKIVTLKAVYLQNDPPFIARQYVDGQSLREFLDEST